jgi:hypothetical protein
VDERKEDSAHPAAQGPNLRASTVGAQQEVLRSWRRSWVPVFLWDAVLSALLA